MENFENTQNKFNLEIESKDLQNNQFNDFPDLLSTITDEIYINLTDIDKIEYFRNDKVSIINIENEANENSTLLENNNIFSRPIKDSNNINNIQDNSNLENCFNNEVLNEYNQEIKEFDIAIIEEFTKEKNEDILNIPENINFKEISNYETKYFSEEINKIKTEIKKENKVKENEINFMESEDNTINHYLIVHQENIKEILEVELEKNNIEDNIIEINDNENKNEIEFENGCLTYQYGNIHNDEVLIIEDIEKNQNFIENNLNSENENKTCENIFETSDLFSRYSPLVKDNKFISYKRKREQMIQESYDSFGFSFDSEINLKKGLSKVEKEKILFKQKESEISGVLLIGDNINVNIENKFKNFISSKEIKNSCFMNDAIIKKSRVEFEKDKFIENLKIKDDEKINKILFNDKSKLLENKLIKKEDWGEFMTKNIKKKSRIELDKEKFMEEKKRYNEELLKIKNTQVKSQVFKFDMFNINENSKNKENFHLNKTENSENLKEKKINIFLNENPLVQINSVCFICKLTLDLNCKYLPVKTFPKCKHSFHSKCMNNLKIIERGSCTRCKFDGDN